MSKYESLCNCELKYTSYYLILDVNEIAYEQQVGPPIVLTYLSLFPELMWPQWTVSEMGYDMCCDRHPRTISW